MQNVRRKKASWVLLPNVTDKCTQHWWAKVRPLKNSVVVTCTYFNAFITRTFPVSPLFTYFTLDLIVIIWLFAGRAYFCLIVYRTCWGKWVFDRIQNKFVRRFHGFYFSFFNFVLILIFLKSSNGLCSLRTFTPDVLLLWIAHR